MSEKQLSIITDKKNEKYAQLISGLISTNDDIIKEIEGELSTKVLGVKDGSLHTVVWNEKQYLSQKAELTSENHLLFIGDTKESKNFKANIILDSTLEKYGICFGWLGKTAILYNKPFTLAFNRSLYLEFFNEFSKFLKENDLNYANQIEIKDKKAVKDYAKKVIEDIKDNKDNPKEIAKHVAASAAAAIGVVHFHKISMPAILLQQAKTSKDIADQQMRYAILKIYLEKLNDFIEQ